MRRLIAIVVVAAVIVWAALWIGSAVMQRVVSSGAGRAWPFGLGTLAGVPQRYPPTSMSRGAARLIALATPLGIDLAPRSRTIDEPSPARPLQFVREQLSKWVNEQIRTPTDQIEPLPSEAGEYLAGRAADLAAVRMLLLSEEPIVWAEDIRDPAAPLPNLLGYLQLTRVLAGRALDRARVGDRGAWDDLRAAWHLNRPLAGRHEIVSNLIALAGARIVNAAARKLPPPTPDWLEELMTFDFRRSVGAAYQAEAWRIADRVYAETTIDAPEGELGRLTRRAVDFVMAPYTRMSAADIADSWRRKVVEIAGTRSCDLDLVAFSRRHPVSRWNIVEREIATPNLDSLWQRVLRFTAEREATARALRLRAGAAPQPHSSCADGRWIYDDGMRFRFSREIGDPAAAANAFPLQFALDARQ